jgi:hypothetical protein
VNAAARAAVILMAPGALALGVYERVERDRMRAHARRQAEVHAGDWPAARDALRGLAALARARRAAEVTVAVRTSLTAADRRRAFEEARHLGCEPLALSPDDEARWVLLGAMREHRQPDGLVAALEPEGMAVARWRGRVPASIAHLALREPLADSGVPPGGEEDALVVSGSLAAALAAGVDGAALARVPRITRAHVAVRAHARARDPLAAAALALRRLMDWTGKDSALVSRDALIDGLAATLMRVALPGPR